MKQTAFMALTAAAVFAALPLTAQTAEVSNSYANTEELAVKFPTINPSPVNNELEAKIQNRLLNGFENWNRGYDAWKAWGDILYTPDSIYNVHGAHLTLAEYQASMNVTLKKTNILMGDFYNMIICDNWTAIRYAITTINNQTGESTPGFVTEFVNFKDYGGELGTRVVEGWGGTKDSSFYGLSYFMNDDERETQNEFYQSILDYKIPSVKNLSRKYPVKYPTKDYGKMAKKIKNFILEDFDSRNSTSSDCQYLYFDSMLIKDDWAAIHYWYVKTDAETGTRTPYDGMEMLHFAKDGNSVKLIERY